MSLSDILTSTSTVYDDWKDFTISRLDCPNIVGFTGQGPTGYTGASGPTGPTGFTGPTGPSANYTAGNFVPAFEFNGSTGGVLYFIQEGRYVKQNELVNYTINLSCNSVTGAAPGNVLISGMPFQSRGTPVNPTVISYIGNFTGGAGFTGIVGLIDQSATKVTLYNQGDFTPVSKTQFMNNTFMSINGFYGASS